MRKTIYPISILLLGLLLFFYIVQRAALLSLTHDESATTNLVFVPLADIMFAPTQFHTANNHILNSILMKWSVLLFGWKEWSIRLPNVLLFVFYFAAAVWYMNRLTKSFPVRIAGIIILCSVPYLLDFFSLARGYGMANAFTLPAFVLLVGYFHSAEKKYLSLSFIFAALAVYSNFTWLNVYLGLWLLLNCGTVLFFSKENGKSLLKSLLSINLYPFAIAIFLTLLIYKPISYLRTQDEFRWGASEWITSFKSFINDLLYGHSFYLTDQEQSAQIITFFLILLTGICCLLFTRHFLRYKKNAFATFHAKASLLSLLLIVIIIAATIAQRHLLHTFYIDGRKATLYIPILLSFLVASASWLKEKYRTAGKSYWILLSAVFIAQFCLSFNFKSCREWWYDASSKQALLTICSDSTTSNKTAVNWLFIHSFNVYNNHFYNRCISKIVRTDAADDQLADIDYYYIIGDEIRNIHPVYKPVKRFFWDRFLLKKDSVNYEIQLLNTMQTNRSAFSNLTEQELRIAADSILVKQRREINWSSLYFTD